MLGIFKSQITLPNERTLLMGHRVIESLNETQIFIQNDLIISVKKLSKMTHQFQKYVSLMLRLTQYIMTQHLLRLSWHKKSFKSCFPKNISNSL